MVHREEYYRKGKENGEFIEYDEEGKVITKGDYTNGLKDGNWFYEVGDHTEKGKYVEGEKDGEWTYYCMTDQLYFEGNYKNGKPIDRHIYYHVNGNKKWIGNYSLGKREGKWIRYNEKGEILVTYTFRNDVLVKTDGKKIKPAFKEELNRE
jgi:antitoxin component YwqK of YwqJK toxin-antitoxin module